MGSVAKGEKCVMELAFQPTTTCTLDNTLVTCRIQGVPLAGPLRPAVGP